VDDSGHGTHVAGILLELTRNVDLYIGKIAESRVCQETKPIAEVAKDLINSPSSILTLRQAIRYAREEWGVDMISLSFGMDKSVSDVREEIAKCIKNDIVVFAAASNDGANSPRTYPATHPNVICVNSTTGEGNPSSFNPTPVNGEDNFSAVGDCIKSTWPVSKSNESGSRYMSGTSFATPVAVAVAAFIIGYIRTEMRGSKLSVEPLSPDGVKKLFSLIKMKRDGFDWVSPARFFKSYNYEDEAVKLMIRHKMNI
jgi:subtilisin family serine protease